MRGTITRLTEGLDTHERADGSVIRLHAGGSLIGEIVIGDPTTRVNFKNEFTPGVDLVAEAEGVRISGRSKSWAGGLRVTSENAAAIKQVLNAIADETIEAQRLARSVRDALTTIEKAAERGVLDDDFEVAIRELLDRRPTTARRHSRRPTGMRVISTA